MDIVKYKEAVQKGQLFLCGFFKVEKKCQIIFMRFDKNRWKFFLLSFFKF